MANKKAKTMHHYEYLLKAYECYIKYKKCGKYVELT